MNINERLKLKINTCCSSAKILEIAGKYAELSALDILRLTDIPAEDRLQLALSIHLTPRKTMHLFACLCAEQALTNANVTDIRCWNAIKTKRLWLNGNTSGEELSKARRAASEAHNEIRSEVKSSRIAAGILKLDSLGFCSVKPTEQMNACFASWEAAASTSPVRDAYRVSKHTAYSVKREWQIEKLIELLEGAEK